MKITFLGTSHGSPEPHRKCSCIMVEIDENIYFVDMGTPVVDELRKRGKAMEAVKGVFITHVHSDHTNGLIQFADLISWYFTNSDPTVVLPDLDLARVIDDWLHVHPDNRKKELRYRKTEAGTVYDDGTLKVTAFPVKHCRASHAYLLEAGGKSVLCTGDIDRYSPDAPFPYVDRKLDLLIGECAHTDPLEYVNVLKNQLTERLYITHYNPERMLRLYELKQHMDSIGMNMVIATDDLEITL